MRKITEEWLKAAQDDLMVIERIMDTEHLTHMVALHAQQAIEKSIKAVMEEKQIKVTKTHNLGTLFSKIKHSFPVMLDQDLLKTLDSLYLDSRYPSDLGLLPNGKPSLEDAQKFYQEARKFYESVKKELE
ncbi:MAG: HEPN domain-containing protein [Deltaproteobacteria bacterium]|nr:HEPN domain-containing protein [Deltaproteobacteria bacterium]MBW2127220.1 HEPN domain-containing protein [Deltaproteobacteria bacterium]